MPRTIPEGSRYHPDATGPDEIDAIREGRSVPVGFRCAGCGEYRSPSPGRPCRDCRTRPRVRCSGCGGYYPATDGGGAACDFCAEHRAPRDGTDDGWGEARDYVGGFDE